MSQPTLFDLSLERPTTRQLAERVKRDGIDALTAAPIRGDQARYQEITCRSALNRVEGMPFRWTLNPYRGCTHGCHYCFARRYQTQLELDAGDDFSSVILVKLNLAEVLRRELTRPAWHPELIALGTATDPYQPAEGRYRLTRQVLEVLVDHPAPIGLITKGPMVVRDRDLLAALSQRARCRVCISIPTVDEATWQKLEPGTASPIQRLKAARALLDAGIEAGVLMAPVIPGLTTATAKLERTIRTIAEHGVPLLGSNLLHLEGGTRNHFLGFLEREYPQLAEPYRRLYRGKYAGTGYAKRVGRQIRALRVRHSPAPAVPSSRASLTRAGASAGSAARSEGATRRATAHPAPRTAS